MIFESYVRHSVDILTPDGETIIIPPSGRIVRSGSARRIMPPIDGIPCCRIVYGAVKGLPAPQAGVGLIVSAIVANEIKKLQPDRADIFSPDQSLRNPRTGQIIGCRGLIKW